MKNKNYCKSDQTSTGIGIIIQNPKEMIVRAVYGYRRTSYGQYIGNPI